MAEYAYVINETVNQIVDIRPDLYSQWVASGNPKAQSYRPDRLVFFAPCVREAIDIIQAATFTTTGTPVVEPHPIRIG